MWSKCNTGVIQIPWKYKTTNSSSLPVSDTQASSSSKYWSRSHTSFFFKDSEMIQKSSELLFLVNSTETGITGAYSGLFLGAHLENYWVFWATGQSEWDGLKTASIVNIVCVFLTTDSPNMWLISVVFLKVFGQQLVSMSLRNKEKDKKVEYHQN